MSKENSESNEARMALIKREAADWVIKKSYDFTAEDQDLFFEWLAANPDHTEAYQQRQEAWKHLDILAEWRPEHSLKPNPDLLEVNEVRVKPKKKIIRYVLALAAVLMLGCLLWFSVIDRSFGGPERLVSGEFARGYERHVLSDGSVVELNLGSQALVEFTKHSRQVSLVSGEAHFTIAKDAKRPFIVTASGVAVQAVGTIFNVQIDDGSVNVLVTEGRVKVGSKMTEDLESASSASVIVPQELSAGQHTIIDLNHGNQSPVIETLSEAELENKLTWLKQVINFDAAPLSEIVFEFNRRNYRKIVIEDPKIENIHLSVTIRPNNIDDFVELLELTSNIRAERIDNSVIILRSR